MAEAASIKLPYAFQWTGTPHVAWVDLHNNKVMVEVAVVNLDMITGDLYYIRTDYLDDVDKRRMLKILNRRDSDKYKLWDLLSQVTLQNGMNALDFFHQMVKVRTAHGQIFSPNSGKRGIALNAFTRPQQGPQEAADPLAHNARKAGRPPKGTS